MNFMNPLMYNASVFKLYSLINLQFIYNNNSNNNIHRIHVASFAVCYKGA